MKVAVLFEFSGVVRDAFIRKGHEATSFDLLESESSFGPHIIGDVKDHDFSDYDLAICHPPCFVADTLILTDSGYKPISEIVVGEFVLTHLGRWRRVTDTMNKTTNEVVKLKSSNSLETITTQEHPYYTRYRRPRLGSELKSERDGEAQFVNAGDLTNDHFTCSVLPPTRKSELSDEDLWLMGRYVADGYMRKSRWTDGKYEEMNIAIGYHKVEHFTEMVSRKHKLNKKPTAMVATFYGNDIITPFAQFGMGAENKMLPEWVLSLPNDQAKVFLDGYLSGDGYDSGRNIQACSTSKKLMLGIAVLMHRVFDKCPSLYSQKYRETFTIEGRTVKSKPIYCTRVTKSNKQLRNYVDGIYAWGRVQNKSVENLTTTVYNLSVEEDETYTANGVVVHNCTHLAVSGARWFKYKQKEQEEALDMVRWCFDLPVEKIAIENPVSIISTRIRKPDGCYHPWMHGEPETKKTCLWLKNLPMLVPSNIVSGRSNRIHTMPPGPNRWKERSRTLVGVANAMAEQWG